MATIVIPPGNTTIPTISASDAIQALAGGGDVTGSSTDLSALSDIASFSIAKECAKNIGVNGSVFKAKITGDFSHFGSGTFVGQAAGTGGNTWAKALLSMQESGQFLGRGGGTFTKVEQNSGYANFDGNVICPTVHQLGGESKYDFITGTNGFQAAEFMGGFAQLARGLDTAGTSGAYMNIGGTARVLVALDTVTDAILATPATTNAPTGTADTNSGIVRVIGPSASLDWRGWNIDTLYVFGGARVDFSMCPFSITIRTLITDIYSRRVSKWKSEVPGVSFTYTNTPVVRGAAANDQSLTS